jgi:hypothetical protein
MTNNREYIKEFKLGVISMVINHKRKVAEVYELPSIGHQS